MSDETPGLRPSEEILRGGLVAKLKKHGTAYLAGSGILAVTGLLLLPVNTRLFSKAEMGAIGALDSARALLAVFAGLHLYAAYRRFYVDHRDTPADLRLLTSTMYWAVLGIGICMVPLALALVSWHDVFGRPLGMALVLAFLAPPLVQLGQIGAMHLQHNHRAWRQAAHVLANVFVHVTVLLVLVGGFGLGLTGKYAGVFLGSLTFGVLGTWVLVRDGLLGRTFSPRMLREALFFSLPWIPGVISSWVTNLSDRVLVARMDSYDAAGVYAVGAQLGKGTDLLAQAVLLVYTPMLLLWLRNDAGKARAHLERFVPSFLVLMLAAGLALSVFADEVIHVLVPSAYGPAAGLIPIIVAGQVVGAQGGALTQVLAYHKRTGVLAAGLVLQAAVNLTGNLVFIPQYGRTAAAWTTLVSMLVIVAWNAAWVARVFPVRVAAGRMLGALVVAGGAVAVCLGPLRESAGMITTGGVLAKATVLVAAVALLVSPPLTPASQRNRWWRMLRGRNDG